jgi:ribosomal protein L32
VSGVAWDRGPAYERVRDLEKSRAREAAREAALEAAGVVVCPNCGADAEVHMLDVTTQMGKSEFVPGYFHCSASCWFEDPEGYLRAVESA